MIGNIAAGLYGIGVPPIPPTSYDSIATVSVGSGGATTIDFTSISSDYKHLQIRYLVRNQSDAYYLKMQFNGDTSSNYSWHDLNGDGSSAAASAGSSQTEIFLPRTSTPAVSNVFTAGVIDILDYTSTSKNKTTRALGGFNSNSADSGQQKIEFMSGLWFKTPEAITSIKFFATGNFAQYSHFALYGIKD